jgi:hypothetical protein
MGFSVNFFSAWKNIKISIRTSKKNRQHSGYLWINTHLTLNSNQSIFRTEITVVCRMAPVYLRYLCVFTCSCVQHILCCGFFLVFFFYFRLVASFFGLPILMVPSVFVNVYKGKPNLEILNINFEININVVRLQCACHFPDICTCNQEFWRLLLISRFRTKLWTTLWSMYKWVRVKTGCLRIRIMYPSGVTCLSADCCFSELALWRSY